MENSGKIIILNGPSSAGKTTLSRSLQKIWDRPLYYLSYDIVDWHVAPFSKTDRDFGVDGVRDFLSVMYESAAAIARSGRDVIIDNCLFDTEDIYELSERIMQGCDTVFVRIRLPISELERRERERGDRQIGKAKWQEEHITPKDDAEYDIVVNTMHPSDECAAAIRDYVKSMG